MKRTIALLAVVLVLALAAIYQNKTKADDASTSAASEEQKAKIGFMAPVVQLSDLDDKQVTVGGEREQLTLVNFWASWCGPCELEAPDLQMLAEEYEGKMVLLGVNATSYDKERQAREFVEDYKFTFPILMDREGVATKQYVINTFPTSLIIDKNGVVKDRIVGVIPIKDWRAKLDKYIKQGDKAA